MRLNQNMQSLNVYKNYRKNLGLRTTALERLTSGTKINSAKDNPNKLGVSEGLRLQIRSLQMAKKNVQDSVSMMQSVDGTLSNIGDTLLRIKELTIQAGSGSNTQNDLETIQIEINQLKEHIDYTVTNSDFNGVNLLHSEKVTNNDKPSYINHMVGANIKEEVKIPVFNINTDTLTDKNGNSLKNVDVADTSKLDENIGIIDEAINQITSIRSKYGALQSSLETYTDNLSEIYSSLTNSESKIRDADIALEMAEYARTSILNDTSLALMQQTNNFPKEVLRVLENLK